MIIATLTYLLFSGGDAGLSFFPEDFSDQVKIIIMDETRRETILDLVGEVKADAANYKKTTKEKIGIILSQSRTHSVDAKELQTLLNAVLNERKNAQAKFLDKRLEISRQIEQEEWEKILN
jgi:hypothetical protein